MSATHLVVFTIIALIFTLLAHHFSGEGDD